MFMHESRIVLFKFIENVRKIRYNILSGTKYFFNSFEIFEIFNIPRSKSDLKKSTKEKQGKNRYEQKKIKRLRVT